MRLVGGGVAIFCVWALAVLALVGRPASVESAPVDLAGGGGYANQEAVQSAAVLVRSQGCAGSVSGSGFVVDGRVLTNRHVVDGASIAAVMAPGTPGVLVDMSVLGRSNRIDAAVLGPVPQGLGVDWLTLAEADAEIGEEVHLVGWVDGRLHRREATVHLFTDGEVYSIDGAVMLIEGATTFGFSGGPVLNGKGEVVAMLQSVDLATSLTLAIPVSELRETMSNDLNGGGSPSC